VRSFAFVMIGSFALASGCVRPSARVFREARPVDADEMATGVTLATFADELGLSLEPSPLEEGTTATHVFVFNRGSRTWIIPLERTEDGERNVALHVRDTASPEHALRPAPHTKVQCPRVRSREAVTVAPGARSMIACVEQLVDVGDVEELELEADLHFTAADGSAIRIRSPAFRVARRQTRSKR
jgi:hypothetical protein